MVVVRLFKIAAATIFVDVVVAAVTSATVAIGNTVVVVAAAAFVFQSLQRLFSQANSN